MNDFPGQYDTLDTFTFRAAVEAVLGVTLRGEQANQETVNAWLETAVDPEIPNRRVRGREGGRSRMPRRRSEPKRGRPLLASGSL